VFIVPPARASCAPLRADSLFYRFTVAAAIDDGDRAYAALDHTARERERRGRRCARTNVVAVPTIAL
jgi:hypothetical protein